MFALNVNAQRGRLVTPTTDFSLNAGVSIGKINEREGNALLGNINLTSNQPYGRHIFEISGSQANNAYELSNSLVAADSFLPLNANVHYTYMHELFSYYPSCQIANQVLAGVRLNADWLFTHNEELSMTQTDFTMKDYNHYSFDVSIATDYNFDKRNYATFQFYVPIWARFAGGEETVLESAATIADRFEIENYFDTNVQTMFVPDHFKFGAVFTYRMMFSDAVGLLFKYHGKLTGKTNYVIEATNENMELTQSAHELTLGLIFHRDNGVKY